MSVQCLVFVRADGSTVRTLVDSYPERWIVRDDVPYQRGDIAWKEDADNAPGAMVYVEVSPRRYEAERESLRGNSERASRDFLAMPALRQSKSDDT